MLLQAVGLSCGHTKPVLTGIDLAIREGEAIALLGPNGSGKSTLIKTLSGLLAPLAGEILIKGDDVRSFDVRAVAQRIASVPQEEVVPFSFTIRQLVTMGRLAKSRTLLDTLDDAQSAEIAMERADCMHLANRVANETSGGERQRALIARAIAQDTPILLMDEPSAHLDASHQAWLVRLGRELANEGKAVIAALHDLNLAVGMANRAILLHEGQIIMDAPTREVLESERLDIAFHTQFDRLTTESGRLVVVPKLD